MTEPLSMNRIIHAAVRRDVTRTEQALRAMADGDTARAGQVRTAWRNLVDELTHHHRAEDAHIWPLLERRGFDRTLLADMEAEHTAMKHALAAASSAIDALVAAPSAAGAAAAADAVAACSGVVEGHLEHEERDIEPIAAALQDDPEWRAMTKGLRHPRIVDAANALAWMQDGAGDRERSSLRSHVPVPVVSLLTLLLARRYRREVAPAWR